MTFFPVRVPRPAVVRTACALIALLPALAAGQAGRPMTTDDLMRIKGVGGVALSPNGERVLYAVSGWEHPSAKGDTALGDRHERRSHLWVVP